MGNANAVLGLEILVEMPSEEEASILVLVVLLAVFLVLFLRLHTLLAVYKQICNLSDLL